jgi:hypothetical protein
LLVIAWWPNYTLGSDLHSEHPVEASCLKRLSTILQRLKATQGVHALETTDPGPFGRFDRHPRTLSIHAGLSPAEKVIIAQHEAVHATTDTNIRKHVNIESSLWGTGFYSDAPSTETPKGYESFYQFDEIKAYRKTSKHLAQAMKPPERLGGTHAADLQRLEGHNLRDDSRAFANVSKKYFQQLDLAIEKSKQTKEPLNLQIRPYAEDTPGIYFVRIFLTEESRPFHGIAIDIPFFDPTVWATYHGELKADPATLYPYLHEVCAAGLKTADRYAQ